MELAQIRLESQNAKRGIHTIKAVQEIQQPKAELSIEQPNAELTIKTTPGKLTIDQTEAWADMDLKHISRRIAEAADKGYQDSLEGIARRAQEGNELLRIENGGNPIAQIAKRKSDGPELQFNIGWIPSYFSVKTNYVPAEVDIQVKVNKPIINAGINKPIHEYTPGNVDIYLDQRQSLKIDFANLKYKGINYEQEI
ncbi:hypothetical protein DZB84_21205 [Bacillus sp. HNG]|uniref:DUF6470 family protein n=1 Tax=Bacillus sp. HNG TaxID=2293325 RepID=UPI000E2F01C8|nr:DUF6470 family protein [Bacillus sp. HNG]RFB11031.1 hypothetical protein DZB84_21205 [Bacillus sp. HNG]